VTDAKIVVDRYLQQPEEGDAHLRDVIADAMRFHTVAAAAWNAWMREDPLAYLRAVGPVALLKARGGAAQQDCPAAVEATHADLPQKAGGGFGPRSMPRGMETQASVHAASALWSCASDKLAEAEKLMTERGK